MTYIVARYYFDSLFKEEAEKNLLEDIQASPLYRSSRYSYAVGHVDSDELEGLQIIRGQIGRIPSEHEGFVYDTAQKDFIIGDREEFADIILDFCLIPAKKLMLIEQNSYFAAETAISHFRKIYLQSNKSYVSSFTIDFLLDEENVYEEIRQWKRFTHVKFKDLRRSNPNPNDDFAEIERLIIESGADRVNLEIATDYDADRQEGNTLNADSTLVKQPLALSSHGYGNGEITGIDQDDKQQTVKTYKYKKTVDIDFREDGSIDRIKQVVEEVDDENEQD